MVDQQVDLKKEEIEACLAYQANNLLQELQVREPDQNFCLGDNVDCYQNNLLPQQQQQQFLLFQQKTTTTTTAAQSLKKE